MRYLRPRPREEVAPDPSARVLQFVYWVFDPPMGGGLYPVAMYGSKVPAMV